MNEKLIVDALYKTDEQLYSEVGGKSSFLSAIGKRGARVQRYRRYERGDHNANLTENQRRLLNITKDKAELNEANANYCSIVVDQMAGRLSVGEINSADDAVAEWIGETMERNNFEAQQGEWFRGAIRDSESFVVIDPQTALWSSHPTFDGYSGIVALFDPVTGLPSWVCKLWMVSEPADISTDADDLGEEDRVYIVVYQPDRITYWKGKAGAGSVEPKMVNEASLPIIDEGNGYEWELGLIPVVQFTNKRDNYSPYGESEIRSVIPLQDILNGTLYDMMMASKLSAFKIYWSIGMEVDKDGIVPGSVINLTLKDENGNLLTNLDEELVRFLSAVKVGEFGTTDMSQYTNQLDKLEREISQVTSTPIYGITSMGALSGEALRQLEGGLINKVVRFQKENTDAVRRLFKLTAQIQNQFDVEASFLRKFERHIIAFLGLSAPSTPPKELDSVNISWKPAEIVNVPEQITALSQMRRDSPNLWGDDFYRERIGSLLGMSTSQIAEEAEAAETARVSAFDQLVGGRGGQPPVV